MARPAAFWLRPISPVGNAPSPRQMSTARRRSERLSRRFGTNAESKRRVRMRGGLIGEAPFSLAAPGSDGLVFERGRRDEGSVGRDAGTSQATLGPARRWPPAQHGLLRKGRANRRLRARRRWLHPRLA